MIEQESYPFLQDFTLHDNRDWLAISKPCYIKPQNNSIEVLAQSVNSISLFNSSLTNLDPTKCAYRIPKNVRFSKDIWVTGSWPNVLKLRLMIKRILNPTSSIYSSLKEKKRSLKSDLPHFDGLLIELLISISEHINPIRRHVNLLAENQ